MRLSPRGGRRSAGKRQTWAGRLSLETQINRSAEAVKWVEGSTLRAALVRRRGLREVGEPCHASKLSTGTRWARPVRTTTCGGTTLLLASLNLPHFSTRNCSLWVVDIVRPAPSACVRLFQKHADLKIRPPPPKGSISNLRAKIVRNPPSLVQGWNRDPWISLEPLFNPICAHVRSPAAPALCAPEQGSGKHAQMPNYERAEILAPPIDGELPKNLCGLQTLSETALPHQGRNALPHSCMESATVEGGSRASGSAGLPGSHPGMSKGRGAYDARVAEARPKATGLPLHPADTGPALRLRASS